MLFPFVEDSATDGASVAVEGIYRSVIANGYKSKLSRTILGTPRWTQQRWLAVVSVTCPDRCRGAKLDVGLDSCGRRWTTAALPTPSVVLLVHKLHSCDKVQRVRVVTNIL